MKLVIVESPTKAKTIQKFLGKDFLIKSSFGHVRDLPKSKLGVDIEKDFEPSYIIPTKAKKNLTALKKDTAKADEVILATDEDREGESIAWHLQEALKLKDPKRIVFHEITKTAIDKAIGSPRSIDMNLVNAQQARRILDRIVGYKLSPFLWKKIVKGLSAGRVQSVAVRLVVEREREIAAFKPDEYWSIEALLAKEGKEFTAQLAQIDGKAVDKLEIQKKESSDEILKNLENSDYIVESVEAKETKRHPAPPFTTSTLQQAAYARFKFSAKQTMMFAQKLYEEGNITYHRTDSLNLSESSLFGARDFITSSYGQEYWAGKIVKFKTKSKGAQEAHEAIRPAYPDKTPESLSDIDPKQLKLYTLIWQRFIASQMAPATFDSLALDISAKGGSASGGKASSYTFRANGQTLKFNGFLKVYPTKFEERELPMMQKNDKLDLLKLEGLQHFTEPPARYNEGSLVKALEKNNIGRPSTYAPTLNTIQTRNYITKNDQKRFVPSEIGMMVNDLLVANFPEVVDIEFTAKMEMELDEIADGKDTWQKTIRDFYTPFAKNLEDKYIKVEKKDFTEATDKICPKCGAPVIEKFGRFGKFYACSKFPECKHTESIENKATALNLKCPKCHDGDIVMKKTKRGKMFYGCNKFPACDSAFWDKPIDRLCPTCNSMLTEKGKKIRCSNKECDFVEYAKGDSENS